MESTSIEKLMEKTENRYEAVMVAARRARQINREKGEDNREDEKVTIRALRELLEGKVDFKYEKKEKRK